MGEDKGFHGGGFADASKVGVGGLPLGGSGEHI